MGRVRIVYQMPYTIHGTKDTASLGEAESHGSVRMANQDAIELAKLIMEESGTQKPVYWYSRVLTDSNKMVRVDLQQAIPLTNKKIEGSCAPKPSSVLDRLPTERQVLTGVKKQEQQVEQLYLSHFHSC
jgi:hypothetical protein